MSFRDKRMYYCSVCGAEERAMPSFDGGKGYLPYGWVGQDRRNGFMMCKKCRDAITSMHNINPITINEFKDALAAEKEDENGSEQ